LSLALSGALGGLLAGCASAPHQPPAAAPVAKADDAEAARAQLAEIRAMMTSLNNRLDSIETRMGTLNDKITGTQNSIENIMANRKAFPAPVGAHPSEGAGTEPKVEAAADDPEAGFVSDTAIQDYRKASILCEARKYPEAVLAFSNFVEKYPDHPLAGSAQYGIGSAYFKQKEYKLALHEYERVLTSYDRSPHISDTLRDMAEAEDALKMPEQAARHRQLLTSLFAQSPAASFAPAMAPVEHPVAEHAAAEHATGESARANEARKTAPPAMAPGLDEPPASVPHAALPTAPLTAPGTSEAR
jgi:TolA-binding protein